MAIPNKAAIKKYGAEFVKEFRQVRDTKNAANHTKWLGLNVRFDGLNHYVAEHFELYQDDGQPDSKAARVIMDAMKSMGFISIVPCKGGAMVYIAGEEPVSKRSGAGNFSKWLK